MSEHPYTRRNAVGAIGKFLAGRGGNALLALGLLAMLARLLPREAYGAYATGVAFYELMILLGSLGLEWVVSVYVPKLRMARRTSEMVRLTAAVFGAQLVAYGAIGACTAIFSDELAEFLNVGFAAPAFALFGAVIVVEGVGRTIRDQFLTALMVQGRAQVAQAARPVFFSVALVVCALNGGLPENAVLAVAQLELVACSLSAVASFWCLIHATRNWGLDAPGGQGEPIVGLRAAVKIAATAWIGNFAWFAWGSQVIVLLCTKFLGVEASAVVGFARTLVDQMKRYLPAELLFSTFRPLLVARYAQEKDEAAHFARGGFLVKVNAIFLLVAIVVFGCLGQYITGLISGGKYRESGLVVALWLISLLPWCLHRFVDLSVHLLGRSSHLLWVSCLLAPAPVVMALILEHTRSVVGALLVPFACEAIYAFALLHLFSRRERRGSFDGHEALRFVLAAAPCCAAPIWASGVLGTTLELVGALGLCLLFLLFSLRFARPFSARELGVTPKAVSRVLLDFSR